VQEIATDWKTAASSATPGSFRAACAAYGNAGALKAGEYEIKAGASMRDIMELLKAASRSCTR
jgi:UPF0755 protein